MNMPAKLKYFESRTISACSKCINTFVALFSSTLETGVQKETYFWGVLRNWLSEKITWVGTSAHLFSCFTSAFYVKQLRAWWNPMSPPNWLILWRLVLLLFEQRPNNFTINTTQLEVNLLALIISVLFSIWIHSLKFSAPNATIFPVRINPKVYLYCATLVLQCRTKLRKKTQIQWLYKHVFKTGLTPEVHK